MKKILVLLSSLWALSISGQVPTLEMRYLTPDTKANGETDFHGKTEWMNLEQRIDFLAKYGNYAATFWSNPQLDRPILSPQEVPLTLQGIKPQPTTQTRKTLSLTQWKSYGYRLGKEEEQKKEWKQWEQQEGSKISEGKLALSNCTIKRETEAMKWRFRLKTCLQKEATCYTLHLGNQEQEIISVKLEDQKISVQSGQYSQEKKCKAKSEYQLEVYGDFENKRCFVTLDSTITLKCALDARIPIIDQASFASTGGITYMDDIQLYSFVRDTTNAHTPFYTSLIWDEDFNPVLPIKEWYRPEYNDSQWAEVKLPSVHGGLAEKGESYYLRKKVKIDNCERAILKLETLDPGGEVWINGQPVIVIHNRHPYQLDVTEYLIPHQENLIAVRVKPYKARHQMLHSPSDPHTGWLLGRTELILTSRCTIKDAFVHTSAIREKEAVQSNQITIQYNGVEYYEGSIEVNYHPWYPQEGDMVASIQKKIQIRPSIDNQISLFLDIPEPLLWHPSHPNLYKVEVILKDKTGKVIDDYVTTTGIRTLAQKEGKLYINNKVEMLNGAQILGYRYPIETIAKTNRCVSDETIIQDLLQIKKMNGNMLRIHVHAEKDTIDGINDPRYAEYADQLGVYLLWQTAGWVREGEAWNVDFEGYPQYIRQVYNHPSIVMWEAGNHPNRFKKHDLSDSHDYMNLIYKTITQADTSRLISPTSFWGHTHYGNYDGSIDYKGNPISPNPVIMEKLMTRGNQDAYTGYGAKWTELRNAPYQWAASCIGANDKAFFNFEHEESAAQPNWELAKKEPWYKVQSYEWDYEEKSIGRKLDATEWKISQAFQAFSAWESMKKQILLGYDGFSWCSLESGANMFTYQKPLLDAFGVPKLAYYANKQVFNRMWAASDNVDVVYGPQDLIRPVIFNLDNPCTANLIIELKNEQGKTIEKKTIKGIKVQGNGGITRLDGFQFKEKKAGCYFIIYTLITVQKE